MQIHLSCHISRIEEDAKGGFLLHTDQGRLKEDALILAAGSKAAPATGSDGSGYELAKGLGHSVIKPLRLWCSCAARALCTGRWQACGQTQPSGSLRTESSWQKIGENCSLWITVCRGFPFSR